MQTQLFYKDSRSDKVYQAAIEPRGDGYVVTFAYGRRGGTLTPGEKTSVPVTRETAEVIYKSLVAEKVAKGYKPGEGESTLQRMTATARARNAEEGLPALPARRSSEAGLVEAELGAARAFRLREIEAGLYQDPADGQLHNFNRETEMMEELLPGFIAPQLLNEITANEAVDLVLDDGWMAQPKHDGIRLQIHRRRDQVVAFSRTGKMRTALPQRVMDAVLTCGLPEVVIDGELVGETFYAFEILFFGHPVSQGRTTGWSRRDVREEPAAFRLGLLGNQSDWLPGIQIVETAFSEAAKRKLIARLHSEKAEGVVFKRSRAAYVSGRPNSGGDYLKLKFVTTGSFLVKGMNAKGKRSIELALADGTRVGSCSVPPNKEIPAVGSVCEVRYLYFLNSLVQPCYLGVREDIEPAECTAAQLKHKQEVPE